MTRTAPPSKARLGVALGTGALVALTAITVLAAPTAHASTPASYASLDRASSAACLKASALRNGSVGPVTRFSDRAGMDARVVTGIWPQPHMKGASATMLCLYNRRAKRAEVQELAGGLAVQTPVQAVQAVPIKDRQWRIKAIDGRPPVASGNAPLTLKFGSDGNIAANGGCNGFGGRYMLTGEGLKIYGPMIGTQMACALAVMDQERQLQAILAAAQSLVAQADGTLLLSATDRRTIVLSPGQTAESPGQPMQFINFRCGKQLIAADLSPARAIVELDGQRIELPNRSVGDPESPRMFTNGRVTLFQTIEGPDRSVSLAIGKAAAQRCILMGKS